MNLNKDGDIWACSKTIGWDATGKYNTGYRTVFYDDYSITKIDNKTGKILFHKSVSQILHENNLSNYLLKSPYPKDPIHLNDVQPALKTTPYYMEDDVFLSMKNISLIMHYRPSTNELIELIEGPFISQHDVDIINDSSIVLFNNNVYVKWTDETKKPPTDNSQLLNVGSFYSNIVSYDLKNKKYTFIGKEAFIKNKIRTFTEGLQEFIDPTTYFVEEQNAGEKNPGVLWVFKDDKVIYKDVFKSQHEGYHHLPNWTRVIKEH